MNPVAVDQEIVRLSEKLEERTQDFREHAQLAAQAEHDWKREYAIALVDISRKSAGVKMTVAEREARALLTCVDQHREFLTYDAVMKSTRESLRAIQTQLDALRTLAANYRALTSPGGP